MHIYWYSQASYFRTFLYIWHIVMNVHIMTSYTKSRTASLNVFLDDWLSIVIVRNVTKWTDYANVSSKAANKWWDEFMKLQLRITYFKKD